MKKYRSYLLVALASLVMVGCGGDSGTNAKVVVGQSGKEFYGSIQAKEIVVHQNTKFTWVPYVAPEKKSVIAQNESPMFNKFLIY